jgi:predicted SPOUT superfamily RNA methylase MTH1
MELIKMVLSYLETPQYLRKRLFKIQPQLRYVGVLPPLRSRHHPLTRRWKDLVEGEIRDGVVVKSRKEGVLVDIGVDITALIRNVCLPTGRRVTVEVKKKLIGLEGRILDRSEVPMYWGYQVTSSKQTLGRLMKDPQFDLVIGTSKFGVSIHKSYTDVEDRWRHARKVLVVFGAPSRGLYELAQREKLELVSLTDFIVNFLPNQGVETVRTEEAVFVTLGLLNLFTKS